MEVNNHINYIEFKPHDLEKTKVFYTTAFGWTFTDYGPTFTAFSDSGIAGGFEYTDEPIVNGALVILGHMDLESIEKKVKEAGGQIILETFSFPGGRRFHFKDPTGNEPAIWLET
jgi:predicted enzyme related to lactoylglutathione lyase